MMRGLIKLAGVAAVAAMLGACGFQPLYGEHPGGARTDTEHRKTGLKSDRKPVGKSGNGSYNGPEASFNKKVTPPGLWHRSGKFRFC